MRYLPLVVLALAIARGVDAQPESAYYGIALGSFEYEEADTVGNELFADSTDSYRLMVGYQFLEHLSVEGGWGKTGTIRDSATVFAPGLGTAAIDFRTDFEILTIRLLGVLSFDNGVTLLGGLGYADMKQKFTVNINSTGEASGDITGNEPAYYAGAQYDWDRVAVRLSYEKYDFDGGVDVAETSVSFFYKL
jgi:Outer membrane protein beta-barrel domain